MGITPQMTCSVWGDDLSPIFTRPFLYYQPHGAFSNSPRQSHHSVHFGRIFYRTFRHITMKPGNSNKVRQRKRIGRSNETNLPASIYQHLSRAFSGSAEGTSSPHNYIENRTAVHSNNSITKIGNDSSINDPLSDEENGFLNPPSTMPSIKEVHEPHHVLPHNTKDNNEVVDNITSAESKRKDVIFKDKQFKCKFNPDGSIMNEKETNSHAAFILSKGLKYAASWDSLLSFLCVTGRIRFSRELYAIFRDSLQSVSDNSTNLLSYSSARDNQTIYFNGHCFPKSTIYHIPIHKLPASKTKNLSTILTSSGQKKDVRECVKIVLPSSWAKYDIACYPAFNDVIDGTHHNDDSQLSIEKSAIVQDRVHNTGSTLSFWARYDGVYVNVDVGTTVSISINAFDTDEITRNKFNLINGRDGNCFIECDTGPQWCVTPPNVTSNREEPISVATLSPEEELIYKTFRFSTASLDDGWSELNPRIKKPANKKQRTENTGAQAAMQQDNDLILYPSDIVTILRQTTSPLATKTVCLFISSFVSNVTESESERVVWVDVLDLEKSLRDSDDECNNSAAVQNNIPVLFQTSVRDSPIVHPENTTDIRFYDKRESRPKGTLKDGRDYVVYRFALYADEFGFDGVCGCYMLLLGAAQHNRISSAGVRALTLVPKFQDVNKVLRVILDDIIKGVIHGFEGVDPYGKKVTIFLDMLSLYADYVKVSAVSNSAGHSASCFCPLCNVLRNTKNIGPTYAYSQKTHCRRLGYMKCDEILDVLTSIRFSSQLRTSLGLKTIDSAEADNLPLVYVSNKLRERANEDLPRRQDGGYVVMPFFDSSLSTAVAPDHLLSGLATVLLSACFSSLPTNTSRLKVEHLILTAAAENDLPTEGCFVQISGTKYNGISSMSMSTTYIILLFASRIFKDLEKTSLNTKRIFHIPLLLQSIISHLYYWPEKNIDPTNHISKLHDDNGHKYIVQFEKLVHLYTTAVYNHMTTYGDNALLKDRPNSHRLIELAVHTLPLFGHGKMVSELVLELAHAFFKSWFKQNTHSSSHLSAVDLFVTRIWSSHVLVLYNMYKHGEEEVRELAFSNLLSSFFGDVGPFLSAHLGKLSEEVQSLVETFQEKLDGLMAPPLPRLLLGSMPITFMYDHSKWVCTKRNTKITYDKFTETAVQILSNSLDIPYITLKEDLKFFEKASNTVFGKHNTGTRTYAYKSIYRGVFVSLLSNAPAASKDLIEGLATDTNHRLIVSVHDIVSHNNITYIFARRMKVWNHNADGSSMLWFGRVKETTESVVVIKLTCNIVRVGSQMTTDTDSFSTSNVVSAEPDKPNETKHLLFRAHGYPPCLG